MSDRSTTLPEFVDALQSSGRYTFRREEALASLGLSEIALKSATGRLAAKGRLVAPRRGFYVIVPLEYKTAGAPPPAWFIDDLMGFQEKPYYVGLLSAAALHGAAHQQPQEFQVVTDTPLRAARVGRARIRFFTKKHVSLTPTTAVKTDTGSMRISTPEATALDLIRYAQSVGFLGNVATVLRDLSERLGGEALVDAAREEAELAHVQRLGFLLDLVVGEDLTDPLARWLRDRRPRPAPLRAGRGTAGARKNERWSVLVNEEIEVDE